MRPHPTRELAAMTWEEARNLERGSAVAILPVGAVEAHGPHLPLATDVIIAEAMARAAAEELAAAGRPAVVLPPLAYTAAEFGAGFPGTISVRPTTVGALLRDVAASLGRQGFAALALANAHLDPAHLASLHAAVGLCREEGALPLVFPDLSRKPWALRLGEEFRSGACHAGRYETSVVLAERPELVREEACRALPPNPASLSAAIREGKRSFEESGGPRAYFGWPAEASAAEGRATVRALGAILAEAVAESLA